MVNFVKILGNALSVSRAAGQQINDGVSEVRQHIQNMKRERRTVINLPVSKETTFERVDSMFEIILRDARYFYPKPEHFSRPDFQFPHINADTVLIAQMASTMVEQMKAEIEAFYASATGVSDDERASKLRDIDRKILDAELAEESMIRAAETSGFPITRRRDADPRAVLAHDKVLP